MLDFENVSSRVFAAVSAVAFSAVFFATAIVPANQGLLLPVGMA